MPQDNFQNQPQNQQSAAYNNAQSAPRTINGIAQPMDPMGGDQNPFEIVDQKNGNTWQQQQAPVNQQGMPEGAQQFQTPTSARVNQLPEGDGGASPMDKWFKKPDTTPNGQAPVNPDPNHQAAPNAAPSTPEEFKSVFAKAELKEFQALLGKQDFTKDLFTEELATSFKEGDFSGLPSLINAAVQQGASMSSFASSRLSDQAVNGMFKNFQDSILPGLLNDHSTNTMWQAKGMEDFNSEAMQPMVQMVSKQVRSMFPNASPQEQQAKTLEMLQDYSKSMGEMNFNSGANQQDTKPEVANLSDMERLFN